MDTVNALLLLATVSWLFMMTFSVLRARRNFRQGTRTMAWTWCLICLLVVFMGVALLVGFSPLFMEFNVH